MRKSVLCFSVLLMSMSARSSEVSVVPSMVKPLRTEITEEVLRLLSPHKEVITDYWQNKDETESPLTMKLQDTQKTKIGTCQRRILFMIACHATTITIRTYDKSIFYPEKAFRFSLQQEASQDGYTQCRYYRKVTDSKNVLRTKWVTRMPFTEFNGMTSRLTRSK